MTIQVCVVLAALGISVCLPENAGAHGCSPGDGGWTSRFAAIDYTGTANQARLTATSTISHLLAHPSCSGDLHVKAKLIGAGSCTDVSNQVTHGNSSSNVTTTATKLCSGLPNSVSFFTGGEHWWNDEDPDSEDGFSESSTSVYFNPPSCLDNCNGDPGCECGCFQGTWDGTYCYQSPILVKIRNNSANYNLTSLANGVMFDLAAHGIPMQTAWTRDGAPVGFLVIDKNEDGEITSGAEMFGTATVRNDGTAATNGFEALEDLDENGDGSVDAADSRFGSLRLWFDYNHNGQSERREVLTLDQAGVRAFRTRYEERGRRDRHGNWYRFEGSAETVAGDQLRIFDIYFVTDPGGQ